MEWTFGDYVKVALLGAFSWGVIGSLLFIYSNF
jgi:hypothetical protein